MGKTFRGDERRKLDSYKKARDNRKQKRSLQDFTKKSEREKGKDEDIK